MNKTDLKKSELNKRPKLKNNVFIASGAKIIGDVSLDDESSVWYNTVIRGDINAIKIGKKTNIQDNSVIHVENDQGVIIGDNVTVGHNAIIHGCTIDDGALIGMGAILMNGCYIGKGSIIGAGTLIKENSQIPPFSMVVGIPGKIVKTLEMDTLKENIRWAKKYTKLASLHLKHADEIIY
jgi:carbonic anhydrase/acetyltransferase-like protein (isoleucine patch superfamily)